MDFVRLKLLNEFVVFVRFFVLVVLIMICGNIKYREVINIFRNMRVWVFIFESCWIFMCLENIINRKVMEWNCRENGVFNFI